MTISVSSNNTNHCYDDSVSKIMYEMYNLCYFFYEIYVILKPVETVKSDEV